MKPLAERQSEMRQREGRRRRAARRRGRARFAQGNLGTETENAVAYQTLRYLRAARQVRDQSPMRTEEHIRMVHAAVDAQRASRGLKPWKWR